MLAPGYYAAAVGADGIISNVVICPQGYYCPGGDPTAAWNPASGASSPDGTVIKCDFNMWTVDVGAIAKEQCRELLTYTLP